MNDIYYYIYVIFKTIIKYTPSSVRYYLLKMLGYVFYLVDRKRGKIARVNLDLAFGDTMSETEKKKIIKKVHENLIFNMADFVINQDITKDELLSKVKLVNPEIVEREMAEGRPVIAITAHYGNWELMPFVFANRFGPMNIVGRALDSSKMDEVLRAARERFSIRLFDKKGAMRGLISTLKEGHSVGLLVDQNTSSRDGLLIDFFGKKARHTPAAAILAKRTGYKVIPMFIRSDKRHQIYTATFYPPIPMNDSGDKKADILENVQAQAEITEKVIREKPDEWFWIHKRWKNQYEELYP